MGTDTCSCFDVSRLKTEPARLVVEDCVRDFMGSGMTLSSYAEYTFTSLDYLNRLFRTVLPAINENLYIEYLECRHEFNMLYVTSLTDRRDVYFSAVLLYVHSDLPLVSCAESCNVNYSTLRSYIYTRLPLEDLSLFKDFIYTKSAKGHNRSTPADKSLFNSKQTFLFSKCIEIADLVLNHSFSLNDISVHFNMQSTLVFYTLGAYLAPFDFDLYERTICHLKTSRDMMYKQLCISVGASILDGETPKDIISRLGVSCSSFYNYVHSIVKFDCTLYLQVIDILGLHNILDSVYDESFKDN